MDAHMRLYDNKWVDYITNELDKNPNRILCSKSIPLERSEDGQIIISNNSSNPKGAYLVSDPNKLIPDIKWNYYEDSLPKCQKDQIPCILGAGYTTSKKYWEKIKGLKGLIHYGCEEAYISIKAWKEGGGCYLLPKLEIGHLYRKKFPYKVYNFQVYYNYLLISELLFPTSEKCFARSVAWKTQKDFFYTIMEYMDIRKCMNDNLRQYYRTFSGYSFNFIKKMNGLCNGYEQHLTNISEVETNEVMRFISTEYARAASISLFDGLIGVLIAELLYVDYTTQEYIPNIISNIWSLFSERLHKKQDYTFESGLSGIGWGLIYIASYNLVEDSVEKELSFIDRRIMNLSIRRCQDLSFNTGVGGVYCYVTVRLGYNKRNNINRQIFEPCFLEELESESSRILKETKDWRTRNFVSQFMERNQDDWDILPPCFPEVIDLINYVPKSKEKWDFALNGVIGSVINKLTNEYNKRHEKKYLQSSCVYGK